MARRTPFCVPMLCDIEWYNLKCTNTDNNNIKWILTKKLPRRTLSETKCTAAIATTTTEIWARGSTLQQRSCRDAVWLCIEVESCQTVAVASHASGCFLPPIKTLSRSKFCTVLCFSSIFNPKLQLPKKKICYLILMFSNECVRFFCDQAKMFDWIYRARFWMSDFNGYCCFVFAYAYANVRTMSNTMSKSFLEATSFLRRRPFLFSSMI